MLAQTASVRSPYIYAEDNWTDDMELAAACFDMLLLKKIKIIETKSFAYLPKQKRLLPGWVQILQNIINGILLLILAIMNWRNN